MKYLLLLLPLTVFANPEIPSFGPVHFVLNPNNANDEYKTYMGQCKGGVHPYGNGTARGFVKCKVDFPYLPWGHIPEFADKMKIRVTIPGTPCELFDSSNNAGNNQGYDVTQYNSYRWAGEYTAKKREQKDTDGDGVGDYPRLPYKVEFTTICYLGVQQ